NVAVLAADREQDRFLVEGIRDLARSRRLHVEEAALVEHSLLARDLDFDAAAMDEVELVLRVVEVEKAVMPGRHDDPVDPEGRHTERGPNLAEARAVAELVERGERVGHVEHASAVCASGKRPSS